MSERGVAVDHTTIWRWVQRYGPEVQRRRRGQLKLKSSTWHMDETLVRVAGRWLYLFRAVDSHGQTVDFYLSETRDREAANAFWRGHWRIPTIPPHTYLLGMGHEAILPQSATCKMKDDSTDAVGTAPDATPTIGLSRTIDPSNDGSGRCKARGPYPQFGR
jgi:hypothetical protein